MVNIENNSKLVCGHTDEIKANVCSECGASINISGFADDKEFPFKNGYWHCPNCGFKLPVKNK